MRNSCRDCGGSLRCEHGRLKSACMECEGTGMCVHGRLKPVCKECGGGSFCDHGKRRTVCEICGGGGLCIHAKQKGQCRECPGKHKCQHGLITRACRICSPQSSYFCRECHYTCASNKYDSYCVPCFVYKFPDDERSRYARQKYDELRTKAFLADSFPGVFTHNRRIWLGDCTEPYSRYIDFFRADGRLPYDRRG